MPKVMKWFLRIVSLAILAGVYAVLPYVMAGSSRLLAIVHLACLVIAVDFAWLSIIATLVPSSQQRPRTTVSPARSETNSLLQRSLDAAKQKAGERHE